MHSRTHRGTILLFAIAVVTLMVAVVFAFSRVVEYQIAAGRAAVPMTMARNVALYGASHAMEQIKRDYAANPVTTIDGMSRSVFFPTDNPWSGLDYVIDNVASKINIDDVPAENYLHDPPLNPKFAGGSYDHTMLTIQNSMLDGRGRWYEPEYYSLADATAWNSLTSSTPPTKIVRFGDAAAAPVDRSTGVFYDNRWRRTTRTDAKYRVRYAVEVRDLDGLMLMNADSRLDWTKIDSPDYTSYNLATNPGERRTVRWMHVLPNIVPYTINGMAIANRTDSNDTIGARAQHVYLGRGSTANYMRTTSNSTPRTFPLMYRMVGGVGTGLPTAQDQQFWRYSNRSGFHDGKPRNIPGQEQGTAWATDLFANTRTTGVGASGLATGGEQLDFVRGGDASRPWRSAMLGPIYSPATLLRKVAAGDNLLDDYQDSDCGWLEALGCATPFGGGQALSAEGVATPWSFNALTAPIGNIRGLLYGYLPPGVMQIAWVPKSDAGGLFTSKGLWRPFRNNNDLFVNTQSPAFTYDPPARPAGGGNPEIKPDYYVLNMRPSDPGYVLPKNRYPGVLGYCGPDPKALDGNGFYNAKAGQLSYMMVDGTGYKTFASEALAKVEGQLGMGRLLRMALVDYRAANGGVAVYRLIDQPGGLGTTLVKDPYTGKTILSDIDPITAANVSLLGTNVKESINMVSTSNATLGTTGGQDYDCHGRAYGYPNGDWSAALATPAGQTANKYMDKEYIWYYQAGNVGIHPDSFWCDIAMAFSNAICVARRAHTKYRPPHYAGAFNPRIPGGDIWHNPTYAAASWPPKSTKDLDELFLRCLGIDFSNPSSLTTITSWNNNGANLMINPVQILKNCAYFKIDGYSADYDGTNLFNVTAVERSAVMELMINDFRMSFFGSCDNYDAAGGSFEPQDYNGDGRVHCSGYVPSGNIGNYDKLGLLQYASPGTAPANFFCVTGNTWIGRSRFWQILVRGEVWDNLQGKTICGATLETNLVCDPSGEAIKTPSTPSVGLPASRVLFQRWHFNRYRGLTTIDD